MKHTFIFTLFIVIFSAGCFHERTYSYNDDPGYKKAVSVKYVLREDIFLVVFENGRKAKNAEVFAVPTGHAGLPGTVSQESVGTEFELGTVVGFVKAGSCMTVRKVKSVHSFEDMYLAFEVVVESADWNISRVVTVRHLMNNELTNPRIAEKYAYIKQPQ